MGIIFLTGTHCIASAVQEGLVYESCEHLGRYNCSGLVNMWVYEVV